MLAVAIAVGTVADVRYPRRHRVGLVVVEGRSSERIHLQGVCGEEGVQAALHRVQGI